MVKLGGFCNVKKKSVKQNDIEYIEFSNSKKGLFGLLFCMFKFESLIEIKAIKNVVRFNIPKELRTLSNEKSDFFMSIDTKIINNKEEIDLENLMNPELLFKLKSILKCKIDKGE